MLPATCSPSLHRVAHHARIPRRQRAARICLQRHFFRRRFFPTIGYDQGFELNDPRRRREEHLGKLEELAQRGDPVYSRSNLFIPSSDWITFHTVVSTSGDQIAIAPGYLQRDWQQNGRHYFEYSMGSTHIADFFAFLSGPLRRAQRGLPRTANGP